jgi:hypothetical protein
MHVENDLVTEVVGYPDASPAAMRDAPQKIGVSDGT